MLMHFIAPTGILPDHGPTPLYSPRSLSPNRVQSGIGSADLLEELGQALRDNSEAYQDGSFEQPRLFSTLSVKSSSNIFCL